MGSHAGRLLRGGPSRVPYGCQSYENGDTHRVPQNAVLICLLLLVDQIPLPPERVVQSRRGRPAVYSQRLVLKAVVIMVVRRLPSVHALLAVLDQPEMASVRALLCEGGHSPSRRTWERRLKTLPASLPAQLAGLGEEVVQGLPPWRQGGRAAAIASTPLAARGGVWHKTHREAGIVPHTRIDTEAHWTTSGWHGWVYGWKLHLLVSVAPDMGIPLAADLSPANVADNEHALVLLEALVQRQLFIRGDTAYHDPTVREQ